jgi:hypothetical protein
MAKLDFFRDISHGSCRIFEEHLLLGTLENQYQKLMADIYKNRL